MTGILHKAKLGIAVSLISMSAATVVNASNHNDDRTDNHGFFVGAGGYWGLVNDSVDFEDFDLSEINDIDIDDSSFAYNLNAGYRINSWLAVDGGYWNLGEYTSDRLPNGDKLKADASAWTLGGMVSIPLWILDIYARGGVAWWETGKDGDDDGTDWYLGLGAAFNLGGSLDLYGEWVRFDLGGDVGTPIDLLGLGIRWTF
jgi:hypothetical protein